MLLTGVYVRLDNGWTLVPEDSRGRAQYRLSHPNVVAHSEETSERAATPAPDAPLTSEL